MLYEVITDAVVMTTPPMHGGYYIERFETLRSATERRLERVASPDDRQLERRAVEVHGQLRSP